jgi:hypothetical protein
MKAVLGLAAIVIACRLGFTMFMKQVISGTTSPTCIELTGSSTREVDSITTIVGTVRNNCDRRYGYVQVIFLLDRKAGDLGEPYPVSASGRDLEAGATMQIQTLPVSRDTGYRVGEITAY